MEHCLLLTVLLFYLGQGLPKTQFEGVFLELEEGGME